MLSQVLTIARNTFTESIRQPIFFVLVVLSGILQWFNTWGTGFSMGDSSSAEVSGDNKLLLDIGLATVFVFGMLLAAFIATAVVSKEIERRTVLTVVSKPIGRPVVVFGKYLGVLAAILVAVLTMLLFLLMGIRHGVMSIASDKPDAPVIVFSLAAVFLAVALGAVCNYMYGWPFSQTTMLVMLPAMLLAYSLVLFIDKNWHWQSLWHDEYREGLQGIRQWTLKDWMDRRGGLPQNAVKIRVYDDFKPQILLACYGMVLAISVLTAVATAVSTRLGQVMTIVVCASIFMAGLLTNHLLGRRAFTNRDVGVVLQATPYHPAETSFQKTGDRYTLVLENAPTATLSPGMPIYWGANPNGFALAVPPAQPLPSRPGSPQSEPVRYRGIVITSVTDKTLEVRQDGDPPLPVSRPPERGDFIFLAPTRTNHLAAAAWAVMPNMHYFWLLDAVNQNSPIPGHHITLLTGYAVLQSAAFLCLGVVLFQKRDVG